ncbi:hypothetical protein ACOI1H_22755 [Loktanella sp. DJP18]|uniref:hypothetical protein n=1 Tax=Loktanella sp. DJP18 TaxID=3409788 RepID=UPI003BB7D1FE
MTYASYSDASIALSAITDALATLGPSESLLKNRGAQGAEHSILTQTREVMEAAALQICSLRTGFAEEHHGTLMQSLSPALVATLAPLPPGTFHFSGGQWNTLLNYMSHDDIRLFISRGLGIGARQKDVFTKLHDMKDENRARIIADIIANDIAPYESADDNNEQSLWESSDLEDIDADLFAPYLRAQIAAFPNDISARVRYTAEMKSLSPNLLVILFLAGFPQDQLQLPDTGHAVLSKVIRLLSSNHGRMALHRETGTLENYLADKQCRLNAILRI